MPSLNPPFVFPTGLPGLAWPVTKTPTFQTRLRRALSGREERSADYVPQAISRVSNLAEAAVIWQFELTFEFLRGLVAGAVSPFVGPFVGSGRAEIGTLYGFITSTRGPFYPFFFDDPTDDRVAGQPLGNTDGVTSHYQLVRFFGTPPSLLSEAITAPRTVSKVAVVDLNNNPHATPAWSVDQTTGILSFATPPTSGFSVVADFTYWHRCRFTDDAPADFEEFMYTLHSVKSLKFITALGDRTGAPS